MVVAIAFGVTDALYKDATRVWERFGLFMSLAKLGWLTSDYFDTLLIF
jgi:hypothetical protein